MKIERINLSHLRNDAHFQFHTEFRDLVLTHGAAALMIKPQFDEYLLLYEREDEALKKISKSPLTEKIHEADAARDETFSGMAEIVNGMCKHYVKLTSDAAKRIKVVLDTYGNVARKALNEETSAIYNLLEDLKDSKFTADIAACNIGGWATELDTRNKAVEALMKERFNEAGQKSDIVLKDARGYIDKSFNGMADRMNATVLLQGTGIFEPFMRTLNAVIVKYAMRHPHHNHPTPPSATP